MGMISENLIKGFRPSPSQNNPWRLFQSQLDTRIMRYKLEKGLGAVKMQFRDCLCPLFKCLISEEIFEIHTKYDTFYMMVVQ